MPETTTAFVSYARLDWNAPADHPAITYLINNLRAQVAPLVAPNRFELWQDAENLLWGDKWDAALIEAVGSAQLFIPLVSRAYLASHWCRKELAVFLEQENHLGTGRVMPILIRPVSEADLQELEAQIGPDVRECYSQLRARQSEVWKDLPSLDIIQKKQLLDQAARGIRDKIRKLKQPTPPAPQNPAMQAVLPINPENVDDGPIVTGGIDYVADQGHAVLAELCTEGYFEAEIEDKLICFCLKTLGLKVEVAGGKITEPNQKFRSPGCETLEWSARQTGSSQFYKLQIAAKNDALVGHLLVEQDEGTHAHLFYVDPVEGAEVQVSASVQISLQAIEIQQVDAMPVGDADQGATVAMQKAVLNILEEKHGGRFVPLGGTS